MVYHAVQSSHLMPNPPRSSVIASLPHRSPLVCPRPLLYLEEVHGPGCLHPMLTMSQSQWRELSADRPTRRRQSGEIEITLAGSYVTE